MNRSAMALGRRRSNKVEVSSQPRREISADSFWTKLCTYTTVKKCQIVNAKIALSHKAMVLAVLVFIVSNLLIGFQYMLQETPNLVMNAYVEEAQYKATVARLKVSPPSFCDNPATNYTYSAAWTYNNNSCDFDLDMGDIFTKSEGSVYITTYFQDTPSDMVTANAAGLSAGNYFVPGVEALKLTFDHIMTTSWGDNAFNPELHLQASGDTTKNASFAAGQSVSVDIASLLGLAGANLDTKNANSGGADTAGPLYRLSGTHVRVAMTYSNMHIATPFDYTVKTSGIASYTPGVWTSVGPKIVYKADSTGKLHKFERYHYTLRVSFVTTGAIGKPDAFATLTNLAVALGMIGVAVTVVDTACEYLVSNFDDMKYDNRNDWMTLESLKVHAVEEGILDRYAEENGLEILDTDVMKKAREAASRARASKLEAEAFKADIGLGNRGMISTQKDVMTPTRDGSLSVGGAQAEENSWENAMARVLMMEQKAFFAQRPRLDPGRNLQPLPNVKPHREEKV